MVEQETHDEGVPRDPDESESLEGTSSDEGSGARTDLKVDERSPGKAEEKTAWDRSPEPPGPQAPVYRYQPYPPQEPWRAQPRVRKQKPPVLAAPLAVFTLLLISWLGALVLLYTDVGAEEEEHYSNLQIEDDAVFFQLEDVDILEEDEVTIDIIIFVTNYGEGDSGDIRFNVYAQNKTNDIIETRANTTIPGVEAGRTVETQISVRLPTNESFRIKIHLLENNMIVRRGEGQVSLKFLSQSVVDFTTEGGSGGDDSESMEMDDEGANFAVLGAGCFIVIGAIALTIFLFMSGRSSQKKDERRLPK